MTSYLSIQLKKNRRVNSNLVSTGTGRSRINRLQLSNFWKRKSKGRSCGKIYLIDSPMSYFSVSIYQRGCDVHSKFLFDVKFRPSCRWKSGSILASLQFAYFCAMMYSCHCKSVYLHPKVLHPRILHPRILHPKILHPTSICDCITTCEHGFRICWCKIAPAIYQQPDAINILTNK